jgi:molybdopterin converting factor small subunit
MQVTCLLYATVRDAVGTKRLTREVEAGTTVRELLRALGEEFDGRLVALDRQVHVEERAEPVGCSGAPALLTEFERRTIGVGGDRQCPSLGVVAGVDLVDASRSFPVDHIAVSIEHGELAVVGQRPAGPYRYRFTIHAVQRLDGIDGESLDVCHWL